MSSKDSVLEMMELVIDVRRAIEKISRLIDELEARFRCAPARAFSK